MTVKDRVTTSVAVTGLDCADCARTLQAALTDLPGADSCSVQFATGKAVIVHDGTVSEGQIADQCQRLGYRVANPPRATAPRTYAVSGMDCADCARTLSAAVRALPGVETAEAEFAIGRLTIDAPRSLVSDGQVADVAERLGYRLSPVGQSAGARGEHNRWSRRTIELAIATVLSASAIGLSALTDLPYLVPAMHVAAAALAGYPVARAALTSIRVRRADMNVLMTVAAIGAMVLGDWAEASTLMVLFGIGLALQSASIDRTRGAIRALLEIAPTTARVRHGDEFESIPVEQVQPGDLVDVLPGERIPIDGLVRAGTSTVDQAAITGESAPIPVSADSVVLAGSINGESRLEIRSTSHGNDTTVSRIISLVEDAHASKAPAQTLVERFAAIYTPVVIGLAIALAVLGTALSGGDTEWIYRALVLLVVACPCALVISTPVAFVSALGRATNLGVLFKGGAAVEGLARVRQIAFDKTGTITHGRPDVTSITPVDGVSRNDVTALAAGLEAGASHPIGRGIVRAAAGLTVPLVEDIAVVPGQGLRGRSNGQRVAIGSAAMMSSIPGELATVVQGIEARGETAVFVERAGSVIGVIAVADTIRPSSAGVVQRLRALGLKTHLLSGDAPVVARAIGTSAGIDVVQGGLMPAGKVEAIVEAERSGPVAMIGDGINDAPALARASVGIAMGAGGSAVAIEAADVALMSDDLTQLPRAIRLARSTRAVILQNIAFALVTKVAFVGLTATGYTSLWLAVVADVGASLIVTFNALRLLRVDLD